MAQEMTVEQKRWQEEWDRKREFSERINRMKHDMGKLIDDGYYDKATQIATCILALRS